MLGQSWKDEVAQFTSDELFVSEARGLGRVTCQTLAAAWPSMTDEEGFADRTNGLPKYVVSTTLQREALSRRPRVGRMNKANNCSVALNASLDDES